MEETASSAPSRFQHHTYHYLPFFPYFVFTTFLPMERLFYFTPTILTYVSLEPEGPHARVTSGLGLQARIPGLRRTPESIRVTPLGCINKKRTFIG